MDVNQIRIGHVYGNGKGMFRNVTRFTSTLGREVSEPYNVWYSRCTESGAIYGKERVCWCATFATWAKEDRGPVGSVLAEGVNA